MHCQLLLPDLFWPEREATEAYRDLGTPALDLLLARGRRGSETESDESDMAQAWLCKRFELDKRGDWPAAPYCLLADGGEPGPHHWLRADPVHLRLEGGRLVLADSGVFPVSQQEAESIADSLNAHFADEDLIFYPLRPDRWYLRTASAPEIETTALAQAAGRSIDKLLPRGADARYWRARLNDIQMLLHQHPVNERREDAGTLPINSVWLWGGGSLSGAVHAPFNAVWSSDPFAVGLAQAARIAARTPPELAAELLGASAEDGVHLVLLDALRAPAQYGDLQGWREALQNLERDWLAPLLEALKRGRIGMLTVHGFGPGNSLSAEVTGGDLRRFWRRAKPLAHYASA